MLGQLDGYKKIIMNNNVFILITISVLSGCIKQPCILNDTLKMSRGNCKQLLEVLKYYEQRNDTAKYRAALFLIENMKWHKFYEKVDYFDPKISRLYKKLDCVYFQIIKEFDKIEDLDSSKYLQGKLQISEEVIRCLMAETSFDTNVVAKLGIYNDCQEINASFLISHIENAFKVWNESSYAQFLTFAEFCEYILPYRSYWGTRFFYSGAWLNEYFAEHIWHGETFDFEGYLKRYNHYVANMFSFTYPFSVNKQVGIYDLFMDSYKECADLADYACSIFRACGFPVAVDYTIAFKAYPGCHFYCSVLDSSGIWRCFNPGSNRVGYVAPTSHAFLNLYRNTFEAQKNTPYLLKNKTEQIPLELSSPCIKDVTAEQKEVVEITLPFTKSTDNNLAYLATFSKNASSGLIALTWGVVDKVEKHVTFECSLYNTLYFPVYVKNGEFCAFEDPFYVIKDSLAGGKGQLCYICQKEACKDTGDLILTRKYPCKPHLVAEMNYMVGGYFEGANKKDFSDAKTLFKILESPKPYWQEYVLNNNQSYQYYRYVSPSSHPVANVAELEFLIVGDTMLKYATSATPLPIFKEEDIQKYKHDCSIQVVEEDTLCMRNRIWFDKNPMTYSLDRFNTIYLPIPMVIDKVRMLPRNAGNGIRPGDRYLLKYWDDGWKDFAIQKAKYNFLKFENVPLNKIYWLQNLDQGIEDLPFIYNDNQQKFIYESVVVDTNLFKSGYGRSIYRI